MTTAALEKLFGELEDSVKVVVLNACFSDAQAKAIVRSIPCAVGMRTAISDEAAIQFARIFYLALGEGSSVQDSYHFAVSQLMVVQLPEETTPALIAKDDVSASDIYLAGAATFAGVEGWWELGGYSASGNRRHEYSIEIKNNEGYALTTDSTHFKPGDLVMRISRRSGLLFTADGMDPGSGKWYPGSVVGRLSEDGKSIKLEVAGGGSAELRRLSGLGGPVVGQAGECDLAERASLGRSAEW